jgi:hypothetical protein
MSSEIKADKWSPASGTSATIGDSGDTYTVPTGANFTVTDELKTNKISPASGTSFILGDSGDTFTIPAGATLANNGTATGFGLTNWSESSGNLLATNASYGIYLGVNSATASQLLHDYEEGSFVPSWTVTGATLNSVANNYANYTKIGSLVHVDFGAVLVTSSGTPSRYNVTNMPYQANQNAVGSGYEYGQTGTMQMCNIDPNSTTVFMRKYDGNNIASAYLKMSITYQTSA